MMMSHRHLPSAQVITATLQFKLLCYMLPRLLHPQVVVLKLKLPLLTVPWPAATESFRRWLSALQMTRRRAPERTALFLATAALQRKRLMHFNRLLQRRKLLRLKQSLETKRATPPSLPPLTALVPLQQPQMGQQ